MLAHLTGWSEAVTWVGPAVPVAALFAVALAEAVFLAGRIWAKAAWAAAALLCGASAAAALHLQQQVRETADADRLAAETAALRGLWSQWETVSRSLPAPSGDAPAAFDTVDDALASLSAKVASVDAQITALKASLKNRSVDPGTAAGLSDFLRQYGSYRAVVSCPPGDLEAFTYANQLANILRSAGWDANGPETSATLGDGTAMGITLFVRDPAAPGAAKVLVEAFARFNVPYRSAIAENDAIPDTATVELYVPKKP